MIKILKLLKNMLNLILAVEAYYSGNRDKILKLTDEIKIIKGYISDAERILKRIK